MPQMCQNVNMDQIYKYTMANLSDHIMLLTRVQFSRTVYTNQMQCNLLGSLCVLELFLYHYIDVWTLLPNRIFV